MTFCVGIKVNDGIVALADTRIVRDSEQVNKQKLAEFQHAGQSLFTMTSGLRSVRDKTLTYVDEKLRTDAITCERMYQFVNLVGEQLRRVKFEDGPSLAATNHSFNLHAIVGGRLSGDQTPLLYYMYPEGNWIEAAIDSPYFIIGRTHYGKPILDRLLNYNTSLPSAVTLALLAFDATRTSVTDVDYLSGICSIQLESRLPLDWFVLEWDAMPLMSRLQRSQARPRLWKRKCGRTHQMLAFRKPTIRPYQPLSSHPLRVQCGFAAF